MIKAQDLKKDGQSYLLNKMKSNSDKNQTKLPWWVELLFVQIGLPEKLLLSILNLKKKSEAHITTNSQYYKLLTIITPTTRLFLSRKAKD